MCSNTLDPGGHMYMTVNSKQNIDEFTSNCPSSFRFRLDSMIDFTSNDYEVAPLDFTCTMQDKQEMDGMIPVFIYLDITQRQCVHGKKQHLIRYTCLRKGKFQNKKFDDPRYVPVQPYKTDTMTINIKNADTEVDFTHLENVTRCTLHFRRRRTLWLIN